MEKILSEKLNLESLKQNFFQAKPFPHVIIDNFFEQSHFEQLSNELNDYYDSKKNQGRSFNTSVESNKWGSENLSIPPMLMETGNFLQSEDFRKFLFNLTGFESLKTTEETNSAGYNFFHVMRPNSYLGPHTDHTVDMGPNKNLYHVLNIIIYVQNKWDPNWGGGTTLFNTDIKVATDVEYRPNRALVFMHSPKSIHGTQRVAAAAEYGRMSLYFDYYSELKNPYKHVDFPTFPLIKSPHIFYLPKKVDYLKKVNRKYLMFHLSHYKNLLKHYVLK